MSKSQVVQFVRENRALIESSARKAARIIATSLGTKGVLDSEWVMFWLSLAGLLVIEGWSFYEQSKSAEGKEQPKARGNEGNDQYPV